MLFSKTLFLILFSMSGAMASDLKTTIESKELGSCETQNLLYSAMRFYKIPLNEKYDNTYDVYLRVILFFNQDGSLSLRSTTQALIGCQTSTSGEELCSFKPLYDQWLKGVYTTDKAVHVSLLGDIVFTNPANINRGFTLTFKKDFLYPHLEGQSFPGGMVSVNFNQDGKNVLNICK
ncbi:hypothetical protein DOM21_10940 [Bacteriovorax stolpii]|nr:hypothetical protein DOM21_10940 [Bacteriovorax stolpii]